MKNRRIISKHTDTVLQGDKVAETQTHLPQCVHEDSHTATAIHRCTHTKPRVDGGIKQKINTAAKLRDNGRLVQEAHTQ